MRRRSEDPTNQSTIPVLDSADNPLMPTRPSRARRLIRQGRAVKTWRKGLFCIRMTDVSAGDDDVIVDGVELNIDPGAKSTGLAVVSDGEYGRKAHALIELRHRGSRVRNKMDKRRMMRRSRRGRLRNRQPRVRQPNPTRRLAPAVDADATCEHRDMDRAFSRAVSHQVRPGGDRAVRYTTDAGRRDKRSGVPAGRPCELAAQELRVPSRRKALRLLRQHEGGAIRARPYRATQSWGR